MSRRQKRKSLQATGNSRKAKRWGKPLIVFAVVVCVAAVICLKSVEGYMQSVEFRQKVADEIAVKIGAPVELENLEWSGLELESAGFSASSEGALTRVSGADLTLDVSTPFWKRDVWNVRNVELESVSLQLDLRKEFSVMEELPESPETWLEKMLPKEAVLHDVLVRDIDVAVTTEDGFFRLSEARVNAQREGNGYSVKLNGGGVVLPFSLLHPIELEKAELNYLEDQVFLNQALLKVAKSGELRLEGEVALESKLYAFVGELAGLQCRDIVSEDWKQRLKGDIEASFKLLPNQHLQPEVNGAMRVTNAELTALPILDTIATYTRVSDFRTLKFSELSCDFNYSDQLIRLTRIKARCGEMLSIAGNLDIEGDKLKGELMVGVERGMLKNIPGAEGKVFTLGEGGMAWATVKIGGTTDHVEENLTARLKAAAIESITDLFDPKKALKIGEDLATGDVLEKAVEGGGNLLDTEVIEEPLKAGSSIIESGLNSLFGGSD